MICTECHAAPATVADVCRACSSLPRVRRRLHPLNGKCAICGDPTNPRATAARYCDPCRYAIARGEVEVVA